MTVPFVPVDHWKAEYFGNTTLSGVPVATVDEGTGFVDHSWGTGGPANLTDDFSARFTRTVTLAAGTYRFTVVTDDGSRLWIDDQPTIAAWWVHGPTTHTVDVALSAGEHTLRYEYYEHTGGATARLTWELRTPVVLASGESLGENQTRVSLDGATYGTTGSLTYRWERAGVRLDATVAYWTRDGQRCESPIQRVLVSGVRPAPDGVGRTGCGVALGDGIDMVRACYGTPYRDYVIAEKGTTLDALPAGTRIVVFVWGADTRLELVFDQRGQRIIRMELRVAEY